MRGTAVEMDRGWLTLALRCAREPACLGSALIRPLTVQGGSEVTSTHHQAHVKPTVGFFDRTDQQSESMQANTLSAWCVIVRKQPGFGVRQGVLNGVDDKPEGFDGDTDALLAAKALAKAQLQASCHLLVSPRACFACFRQPGIPGKRKLAL